MPRAPRLPALFLIPALLCAPLLAVAAPSTVYRWTDANGQVHFGQNRPETGRYDVIQGKAPGSASAPSAAAAPGAPPAKDAGTAQREREQRFLKQIEAERAAKEKEKAKLRVAKLEAQQKCAEARERAAFFEERTARRLVVQAEDGNYARMDEDEFLKRLESAKADMAANCR